MQRLLQTFASPYTDAAGELWDVFLYGDDDGLAGSWRGRLTFVRRADGVRYDTGVETTQPDQKAVLYWAAGLSSTYFDGAFDRARVAHGGAPVALNKSRRKPNMNRPNWYTNDTDSGWERVKTAFRNDWEQTKHDFGSKTAPDLNQDAGDTVRQATGSEETFDRHENAFRFGYGANSHYRSQYPTWSNDLDTKLRDDYGPDYDRDRDYIRRAYEYRWPSGSSMGSSDTRDERRP